MILNNFIFVRMKQIKFLIYLTIASGFLLACKSQDGLSKKEVKAIEAEKLAHETATTLSFYDWNTGYAKAIRLNKILLVDVYTDWCYWCKVMDKNTYSKDEIIKQLNKDFVCVKFNPEKANDSLKLFDTYVNSKMLQAFLFDRRSSGYPTTTFWVNPQQKEKLQVHAGYKAPEVFSPLLSSLLSLKVPVKTEE